MSKITVQFLGTGDAFGSGGKFQPYIHIKLSDESYMLDFGASSLIAMKRWNIDPSHINAILLTHLHGDHFGGIPFFLIQEQLVSKRSNPILIAGPPGLEARINLAMEVFFPGSSKMQWTFPMNFIEIADLAQIGKLRVTPFSVVHASGSPSYAFRIECEGKVLSYSGDSEWTEALIDAAAGADLFICEAYFFSKRIKYHLDYQTLWEHRSDLKCKRLLVTHMSEDCLARLDEVEMEYVEDEQIIILE
ncbi:MAG: MBL fold metallo-hydrolase [Desulfobaccales bacterium]